MVAFKRNKKYCSVLTELKEGYWVDSCPLFVCGDKGLFPVFKTGGPTGRFPKNHQELILKNIGGKDELENRI
tara:strand:+ start:1006 stop:1221 length:216 start_codon:yes stop_codon:yes gene_type:complete